MSTVPEQSVLLHRRAPTPFALAALILAGCGGGPATMSADEGFRRIQVHEATQENARAAAEACVPDAPCEAATTVCEAAEAICALAHELDDRDALERCRLARRRCPRGDS